MRPPQAVAAAPEPAIIQGKLTPPSPAERLVVRPRLERRLAELIDRHRVVVVSATAGAGKTTAIVAALDRVDAPVAWLGLDWSDAAPGRLVTYLEAALACVLPGIAGVATGALGARIPHAEAAGMLSEAAGDARVVLVVDELERIGDEGDGWPVLESFLRYAAPGLTTVLVSRSPVPAALLGPLPHTRGVVFVGERDLAFTPAEAERALVALGQRTADPAAVVEATGGWVTGVLFEAWRAADHPTGSGGEVDPLHGYLSAHIMGRLPPEDRDFLVATSVLPEVTAARATALGEPSATTRMASLRRAHLPCTWARDGRALRCHSRFREYLLECLQQRGEEAERRQRLAYGRLLADEGLDEEATDELLRAGAPEEALAPAERAIVGVIERLDLEVAERWLTALATVVPAGGQRLTSARLMLELARDDHRASVRLADELQARGALEPLARESATTAALIAWCYLRVSRATEGEALLAVADPSPEVAAVRYANAIDAPVLPQGMPRVPPLTGGPFDVLVLAVHFSFGRLTALPSPPGSRWVDALTEQWRIAALVKSGHTERALELCESLGPVARESVSFRAFVWPVLLIDAGRLGEARTALAEGARLARAAENAISEWFNAGAAARLVLRRDHDPAAARALMDRLVRERGPAPTPLLAEMEQTWRGLADLLDADDTAALARLQAAVDSMEAGDRVLELPTAAVYLAEASWRARDEEAADRAADLALDAARRQGSNHVLLQALADFPAVAARRIDAEPGPGSAWHDLGRALLAQGVALGTRPRTAVELREFGGAAIFVNGEEARPRIAKSYELLALLARAGADGAERDELLDGLFDGRRDESTRAYLRQAIRWLRHVLPEGALVTRGGGLRLDDQLHVRSESVVFEARLAEAARLRGAERLDATLDALALSDRGEYLPDARSTWADERREELVALATDARAAAAELAFAAGRYDEAQRLAEAVLAADPYREATWRLAMQLASTLADEGGVMRAYQACERALAPLGMSPAASTRRMLESLRR